MRDSLGDKLGLILEAPLQQELMDKIDELIARLQEIKNYDFGSQGLGFHSFDRQHISNYLYDISVGVTNLKYKGKSQDQLDKDAKELEASRILSQRRSKVSSKFKSIVTQFAEQFPRHIAILSDEFKFVQPNGSYETISWGGLTSHPEIFIQLIEAFRTLYRSGAYAEAEKRVQQIRDYGFNISSKLVSTEYSSFRTRYSLISDIILSYEGPMVVIEGDEDTNITKKMSSIHEASIPTIIVKDVYKPGECNVRVAHTLKVIHVDNITLEHLGEIIDTIDMVIHHTHNLGELSDIQCMGSDVVEYQLSKLYGKNLLQRTNINIPSTMADNPEELKKFLFKQMKQK
jgi:hypothetical protein